MTPEPSESRDETLVDILRKPTCTVEEAARVLGIGRSLAYDAVKRGDIQSIRVGARRLIPSAVLRRLLQIDSVRETNVED
jgi:excisionase family DNA binding protein